MKLYEALRPILLLEHCKFQVKGPLSEDELATAESILGKTLPPSFRQWLLEIGDEACLFDFYLPFYSLLGEPDTECIVYATRFLNRHGWGLDPDLIVFAGSGQESLWAFDSAVSINGEYPIVEIGGIFSEEGRNYMLWNTSFHRFIFAQTLFWARHLHPALPEVLEDAEFIASINALFDPEIDLGTTDVYKQPQTIEEIRAHFWCKSETPRR
jgi:hypothetical protein